MSPFDNTIIHVTPARYAYQTQAERKALYAEISDRLRPLFPVHRSIFLDDLKRDLDEGFDLEPLS